LILGALTVGSCPADAAWNVGGFFNKNVKVKEKKQKKQKKNKKHVVDESEQYSDSLIDKIQQENNTQNLQAEKTDIAESNIVVEAIEIDGNNLVSSEEILQHLNVKVGDAYSVESVQKNLESIYSMGYFSEKMKAIPVKIDDNSVKLKFIVQENIPIVDFTITGNNSIATGDLFMHDPAKKAQVKNDFRAIAAEMEGGSIGHVCTVNNVPFAVLRSISDGDGGAMDYQTFAEQAAVVSIEIVLDFINKLMK
jgi:5'-methylthioadenosine/S-adenosylhomocysteine nucleosidase